MITRLLLSLLVCLGALANATNNWTPPTGCPTPSFGITNTHWMYMDASYTWDYGSGAERYRSNSFGPYTHYVSKDHPSATDTANTYGSESTPRLTWPQNLTAGAVVQCLNASTPYTFSHSAGRLYISGQGTSALPVYFIGVSNATVNQQVVWMGTNVIVENFKFACGTNTGTRSIRIRQDLAAGNVENLVMRDCEIFGDGTARGTAAVSHDSSTAYTITQPVFFRLKIYDYGNWQNETEDDSHGILFGSGSTINLHVYNSLCYRTGGDFVQYGNGSGSTTATNYGCFIGLNESYENGENAVDIKVGQRIVVSGNYFHDIRPAVSGTAVGEAIAIHYYPTNVAIINNRIFDSDRPISCSNLRSGGYALGNLILRAADYGILLYGGGDWRLAHNTISEANIGLDLYSGGPSSLVLLNDIYQGCTNQFVWWEASGSHTVSTVSNLLVNASGATAFQVGATTYANLAAWQAASSKGQNSVDSNPLFAGSGSYALTESSPAIGAAMDASGIASDFQTAFGFTLNWTDIAGNARVNDIGAYEYQAGSRRATMGGGARLSNGRF